MKKNCVICGKEFEGNSQAKYCSKECNSTARKAMYKYAPKRTVTCVVCGNVFETASHNKNTCSEPCRKKRESQRCVGYQKKKREEQRKLKVEKKKERKPIKRKWQKPEYGPKACARCGETFTPLHSREKYCSAGCRWPNKKAKPEVKKEMSGLDKDRAESSAMGLSYGKWRPWKYFQTGKY